MVNAVRKLTAPLQRRVMLMVGRCVLRLVDDTLRTQGVQVTLLADEVRTAQRLQEFGFTSVPLDGCEGVAVAVAGNRDHLLVIATDDGRYRPTKLQGGESCLYDAEGQRVHLKKGRVLHIYGVKELQIEAETTVTVKAGQKVRLETPDLEVTGNIKAGGDVSDKKGSMAEIRAKHNAHGHQDPQGGTIGAPTVRM